MRLPISKLAEEFAAEHGVKIQTAYAGANILLGQIELARQGDVYVPGDAEYVDMAARKGLVRSRKTICYFVPLIMLRRGNPRRIRSLHDMTRSGIRIGQGDERACAVGRLMPRLLELNGVDRAAWAKNVVLQTPTINDLGMKIKLGTIDAAVVWSSLAAKYSDDADTAPIDPEKNICPRVDAAVLTTSRDPQTAGAFVDFLASSRGRRVLVENGYIVEKP